MCELIDTLWNVNASSNLDIAQVMAELIDTLWNVNKTSASPETHALSN